MSRWHIGRSPDQSGADAVTVEPPPRFLEERIANPLLRRLLRSRLHRLVSDRLLLFSYVGRQSGTRYSMPVAYETQGGQLVVTTLRRHSSWWKNFRDPYPCTVWLRGYAYEAHARATVQTDAVLDWVRWFLDRHPFFGTRLLGVRVAGRGQPSTDQIRAIADELVVVRIRLEEPPRQRSRTASSSMRFSVT